MPPQKSELHESIIDLLRQRGSRLLSIADIHDRLNGDASRDEVARAVEDLESDGVIMPMRGKRYSLLEFTPYHAGRIKIHPDGYGTLFGGDEPDIYVDRRAMKGAMNGDLVVVRVDKRHPKYKKLRGRDFIVGDVTQVLRRAHRTVVGRFHAGDGQPFVVPYDFRIDTDIAIDSEEDTKGARDGEMVNVEIDRYPDRSSHLAHGRIVELLGFIGEPGVDIEVVIRKFHIPHNFPPEVLREADDIPTAVAPVEIAKRVDLRERNIVTIDGETAKDFDDAVEVRKLPNGNYLLGVHIADVAHYVSEGSELDREAFERGTSVYFPGRAVPMLPERLSNGICSLNPRVERLTFSCDIEIDKRGRFVDHKIYKSVIRTKERMTYTNVNAILGGAPPPPAASSFSGAAEGGGAPLRERYAYLIPDFERMLELYEILRARRDARGSIDFDLPEADVVLGESGDIEAIRASERNIAHRLIEEFMLAANEVVATELVLANQPGLYRVHQQPDPQKLEDLKLILKEFKLTLRGDVEDMRPGELQRVLKAVVGTPEERFLTNIILRSMKRAFYSEESTGHFALALQHYCHFTSPIRRYPDLIVHRRLAELIEQGPMYGERLAKIEAAHSLYASQSSEREKRAEDAEREVLEWKKVIFMRDKVGNEYSGIIAGVAPFGIFVELDEIFVQGLVPVATIGGDFWNFADREHRLRGDATNRELRLGDHVRVEVKSIDEDRHQIEFRLLEVAGTPIARRER
ncbi:MAG TPA: ribonuclease R [Thermoanaerobaculia bacterium]|jgi:ribonuclease R|nr:ribonuclease R [Thermoanaerobaculia bacterium]